MAPRYVLCEDCRSPGEVRSLGRIEYDWQESDRSALVFKRIRLTMECPRCGLKEQDYYPDPRRAVAVGR